MQVKLLSLLPHQSLRRPLAPIYGRCKCSPQSPSRRTDFASEYVVAIVDSFDSLCVAVWTSVDNGAADVANPRIRQGSKSDRRQIDWEMGTLGCQDCTSSIPPRPFTT